MASERSQRRIERLLDEAEEAVARLDWGTVRDRAQAVLVFDSENKDASELLDGAERALATSTAPTVSESPSPTVSAAATASYPADQPTSFANGRYQVKRFLGEGGKKRVYLAQDTLLDREVAFALIKTDGLDDVSRTRIQREAQAMGRLGSHPHIVTAFDLGEEQGQPYMVTELMGGGDVEGLIEDAEGHRLPLEQAIGIAVETCRGLEFAHSRGIVHRDLKPGNVWLTSDGAAKIGDFGLAVALDRSRLTTEGMMVGTVSYMPPEQAMGGEVTPRSDLYSLGAMLYEMVTGRPPFLGDDSVAIIGQHINTPPVSPTWHNAQCPRPLDALIMRLLAKDPTERPESASDVLSALDGIDLATSAEQPAVAPDEAHALDSLAGGVFVGRQREMGELKGCLEDALSGRGRLVMLVGEPGIGKTRTAQELATYAGLRGAQVLWGRCYEEQGAPPYWPWVQAIRSYVTDVDPEQLRSEMGAGAADIAEVVSDVRERLPGLEASPQLDSPEQARFRLFDSITAFLKSAARRKPLVLVLDDLHWADHPSLLLLEFVARELANARVLVVGTYRDVELSRQHPLSQTLGELTRERLFQRVLLRGLDREDVGRFIELASGVTPPVGMVEAVHRQTEGNPLFVTEVVRLLVQEGDLTQDRAGQRDSWSVRIPEGVREVIGRRLDRLSERCNETLTIASVVGREFTLEQLSPLIEDISADRLLEVLEEALAARVIEELPQSVGRYQFTHALIQETLAGELSITRRVRLHAIIAQVLEDLYGADAESHAVELAYHFAQAEAVAGTEKLVRYSLLAGERALASYAYEEALSYFQRGLRAKGVNLKDNEPTGDSETAALLFGFACAQACAGETGAGQVVVDSLSKAFGYYVDTKDVGRAVEVAESHLLWSVSWFTTELAKITNRALELVPPDSPVAGRLLVRLGEILGHGEGDYDGAQEAFNRALAIARRDGELGLEAKTLASATRVDFHHNSFQKCLEHGLRAIELAQQVDDLRSELDARYYTAAALVFHSGDHDAASSHASAMLVLAERLRDRQWLTNVFNMNSLLCHVIGDWVGLRDYTDRGLALRPTDSRLLSERARTEYQVGAFDQGDTYLQQLITAAQPESPAGPYNVRAALAIVLAGRITGVWERFDIAEEFANSILASSSAAQSTTQGAHACLALLAVIRGDAARSGEKYMALESRSGTLLENSTLAADRLLGLLSHTMGNLDRSVEHFEVSMAFCRKAGYRPELAWTCCDYADSLRERDGEGDRAKAMALLDESLAVSSELGMRPLMERVLSRREILEA